MPVLAKAALRPHKIEVEKPDGTRLPVTSIDVKESHDRANLLCPTW